MSWNRVIGQQQAISRLQQLEHEARVPHALLFTGPEGAGKMALAVDFASELILGSLTDEAMKANAKAMLADLSHPDLRFVYPTIKAPSMGSDYQPTSGDYARQWHTMISRSAYFTLQGWIKAIGGANQQAMITGAEASATAHWASMKPSQGGLKVCVIWLPERMNLTSANKMLKLLEEPPRDTVFLMVSERPELLLPTIVSRTQRFVVKKTDALSIEQSLQVQRGIDQPTARRVARVANGSWTAALEELDADNENRQFFDMFVMLMRLCYMRDVAGLKKWTEAVSDFGREKERRLLAYFLRMVRENFANNFHNPDLVYMTQEEQQFSKNFSRFINENNVIEISELMNRAYRDIGQNANAKVVFFDLAMNMIILILRK